MPPPEPAHILDALDAVVDALDAQLESRPHAGPDLTVTRGESYAPNDLRTDMMRLIDALKDAVVAEDTKTLSNLSVVAESFSLNRDSSAGVDNSGAGSAKYDVYLWHDAIDSWCFRIPELGLEEKRHEQPDNLAHLAAAAASRAVGAPVKVSLTFAPSTEGAEVSSDPRYSHAAVPAGTAAPPRNPVSEDTQQTHAVP